MKVFNHKPLEISLPELTATQDNGKRHYHTPDGNSYPSVTTVLSILSDAGIEEWRKRVGETEAKAISEHASNRGTNLHACLEDYIKNQDIKFPEDKKSRVKIMFNRLKPILNSVDDVIAQEVPLYSDKLRIAGRTDLIASYKSILSVIDFKGSTKAKKREWILGYFLQGTAYSLMFEERTGIVAEQIVILMSGEIDFSCQVFIGNRNDYIYQLNEVIRQYREQNPDNQFDVHA